MALSCSTLVLKLWHLCAGRGGQLPSENCGRLLSCKCLCDATVASNPFPLPHSSYFQTEERKVLKNQCGL